MTLATARAIFRRTASETATLRAVCIVALALLSLGRAGAHDAPAAPPAVSPGPALSQGQAQQLLGVLDDPGRRAQFETTLRNLARAQGQDPGAPGHVQGAAAGGQPVALQARFSHNLGGLDRFAAAQGRAVARTVGDLALTAPWAARIAQSPARRVELAATLTRPVALVVLGGVFFLLLRLAVRRPQRRLSAYARSVDARIGARDLVDRHEAESAAEADGQAAVRDAAAEAIAHARDPETGHMPPEADAPEHDAPDAGEIAAPTGAAVEAETRARAQAHAEEEARVHHQGALAGLARVLRRLPLAAVRFVLDLVPVLAVPVVAVALQATQGAEAGASDEIVRALTLIAVVVGAGLALFTAVLSPRAPWLRLVVLNDAVAVFLAGWLRVLGVAVGVGLAVVLTLADCDLPDPVVIALTKLLALAMHALIAIMIVNARPYVMALCRRFAARRFAGGMALAIGRIWWIVALALDFGLWLVWAAEVRHGYAAIWLLLVRSIAALVMVRVASVVLFGGLERAYRDGPDYFSASDQTRGRMARYYPALRQTLHVVTAVMLVLVLAMAWGAPFGALFGAHGLGSWVIGALLTIVAALGVGVVVWEVVNILVERHIVSLEGLEDGKARIARVRTLLPMFRTILLVVLVAVIGLTALSEIGVNVGPLLAGASIFGVALGFGSQKLVQDFINGIFLLLENALTVGDAVTLNGTYGVVEHLSLRTVHVRANDGSMNIFPFSSLGQITNYNRDFARAIIIAEVAYATDTDDVVKALQDITAEMRADPDFQDLIIADFILWGVDSFNDSSVTVRGTLPTVPQARWPVQRQFNRRMKKTFEARGIVMPFPTRTLEIAGLDALITPRPEAS